MRTTAHILPFPILLVVLSFLCPSELSLYVAGLRLPPHRVMLLILVPIACWRILSRPDVRIRTFDILVFAHSAWSVCAFSMHGAANGGIVFGGSLALESFAAYVIARAWVRTAETFAATVSALCTAAIISGVIALPETVVHTHLAHDLMATLTGIEDPLKYEKRFGLTRAYGTFDHPIHLGVFCASVFALAWFTTTKQVQRLQRATLLFGAAFVSLSSAPILGFALQLGLVGWDKVTKGVKARISLTVLSVLLFLSLASLFASRSPFAWIATGLTIDPWNGYYRLLIWEHGLNNVYNNPWIGIGLADWARPWWMASPSIDAFWLVITMRVGIPGIVFLTLALAFLLHAVARQTRRRRDRQFRRYAKAWVITFIALVLMGCTVHYWNVLHAYFFFFVGLSGWIADPRRKRKTPYTSPRVASASMPNQPTSRWAPAA